MYRRRTRSVPWPQRYRGRLSLTDTLSVNVRYTQLRWSPLPATDDARRSPPPSTRTCWQASTPMSRRTPNLDRSAVIDEALRLWRTRVLEQAMENQFADPDGVDPAERQAWDRLRSAAVARQSATEPRDA